MRRRGHRFPSSGQAAVETALLLPVILLILLLAIDVGRVFFDYLAMQNAAHEGGLYGARYPADTTGIAAHAQQAASGYTLTVTSTQTTNAADNNRAMIVVAVSYTHRPLIPVTLLGVTLGVLPVTAQAQFPVLT